MKPKPTLLFLTLSVLSFYACKKSSNDHTSIAGKWSIEKTVYHYAQDTTVYGIATDYYNFAVGGVLTIQDHQNTDVGKYSMNGSNSVGILLYTFNGHGTGVTVPATDFTISYLAANRIVLSSPPIPSGQTLIYLKKAD